MRVIAAFILAGSLILSASPQAVFPPGEQKQVIDSARSLALQYTANLPNFICTETFRRSRQAKPSQAWKLVDTIAVDVAFSEKGERYNVLTINGKSSRKRFSDLGGAMSDGDFGTVLRWIFQPESQTAFHFEQTEELRGRPMHVFSYRVEQNHSQFQVHANNLHMVAAFSGLVYVDRENNRVMRITYAPSGIPADWPITRALSELDYGFAEIGGQEFLLPLHAELSVTMKDGGQDRNEMQFGNYRKFSSEATLKFESQ
jgi:hypothetical protein